MSIFQIISVLFALFMMYTVHINRRKKVLDKTEVSFWFTLWVLFIVFALFPNTLIGIVDFLHFTRVFDLLLVGAMMILSIIVIKTYLSQKESEKKFEDFIRKDALKK